MRIALIIYVHRHKYVTYFFPGVHLVETFLKETAGLDIKQFGPLAQGASRLEKLLARGPVDLRSY